MKIKPIRNKILFQFLENIINGKFEEQTKSGIFILEKHSSQIKESRWGKVCLIGPEVENVNVEDYILIENLRWTNAMEIDGEKYWATNEEEVLATSDVAPI